MGWPGAYGAANRWWKDKEAFDQVGVWQVSPQAHSEPARRAGQPVGAFGRVIWRSVLKAQREPAILIGL